MDKEESWSNTTLTTKAKFLCSSVKDLNSMRKYVYGAVALFSVLVAICLGLRADIQDAQASVKKVREQHTKEYREMELSIRKEIKTLEASVNKHLLDLGIDNGINRAQHIKITDQLKNMEDKFEHMDKKNDKILSHLMERK